MTVLAMGLLESRVWGLDWRWRGWRVGGGSRRTGGGGGRLELWCGAAGQGSAGDDDAAGTEVEVSGLPFHVDATALSQGPGACLF